MYSECTDVLYPVITQSAEHRELAYALHLDQVKVHGHGADIPLSHLRVDGRMTRELSNRAKSILDARDEIRASSFHIGMVRQLSVLLSFLPA